MRHGKGVDKRPYSSGVKNHKKDKMQLILYWYPRVHVTKSGDIKKSTTVSLCKYSAVTVTHLNVRTSINMQTLKLIFFLNKENNSDCST